MKSMNLKEVFNVLKEESFPDPQGFQQKMNRLEKSSRETPEFFQSKKIGSMFIYKQAGKYVVQPVSITLGPTSEWLNFGDKRELEDWMYQADIK